MRESGCQSRLRLRAGLRRVFVAPLCGLVFGVVLRQAATERSAASVSMRAVHG